MRPTTQQATIHSTNRVRRPMPNRLSQERPPYLWQNAENPVDWYPWGKKRFADFVIRSGPATATLAGNRYYDNVKRADAQTAQ